jgi:hypothetical protein
VNCGDTINSMDARRGLRDHQAGLQHLRRFDHGNDVPAAAPPCVLTELQHSALGAHQAGRPDVGRQPNADRRGCHQALALLFLSKRRHDVLLAKPTLPRFKPQQHRYSKAHEGEEGHPECRVTGNSATPSDKGHQHCHEHNHLISQDFQQALSRDWLPRSVRQ